MENQINSAILKAEIKSILAFKAQKGASFGEIKDEYANLIGKELNFSSLVEFIPFMRTMEDVYAVTQTDGNLHWFSNSVKSQHISTMVKQQKAPREFPERCHQLPFKQKKTYNLKTTCYYNDNYIYKDKERNYKSYYNSNEIKKYRRSNVFYNYQLVGDDFFLNMALLDCKQPLEFITKKNGRPIKRCGHCVSGQTIRSLTKQMQSGLKLSKHIILNIGSVDLLQGRDFYEMRDDYLELYNELESNGYDAVITTLAPLANLRFSSDVQQNWLKVNSFLIDSFPNVLDITSCFLSTSNRVMFECYQPVYLNKTKMIWNCLFRVSKYVSGCSQAHLLWNYLGRQRVINHLKKSFCELAYNNLIFN